ncbi:hypothetical protein EDB84DRAFT_1571624 [Lactarius hengduanensis]|nr:hypothetical protein EDB84DRAFT_1571624 [Lactarius hengduanensis]
MQHHVRFDFLTLFVVSCARSEPTVPCCDVCDPSLLDLVRPGLRPKSTTKKLAYSKQPNLKIVSALRNWRQKVLIDDKHPRYLPASYILSEEAINKLASLSPCTESTVEGYLSQQWISWAMYGSDVTAVIVSSIPNLATEHQHNSGLGAVHGSGSTQTSPQRQKRTRHAVTNTALERRNCGVFFMVTIPIPIITPPIPATRLRCTQQRATNSPIPFAPTQVAATNTLSFISTFCALQRTAWPSLPIPTTSVKTARDVDWHGSVTSSPTPAPTIAHAILPFTSYSALQRTAWPVPTTPVKPARDVNALTLTDSEGSFEHAFLEPFPTSSTTSRPERSPLFHPCP